MSSATEKLFDFLGDIIYQPQNADLDLESLDEEHKKLGQGLIFLRDMLKEKDTFLEALARGDLSAKIPSKDNVMAAKLKALHASLLHLTWQTQQVAAGDYQQRVDFMGEFTEAFNKMITQLDTRQRGLEAEIQRSNEKSLALEQSNVLFLNIAESISLGIMVFDEKTEKILFLNNSAENYIQKNKKLTKILSDEYHKIKSDYFEVSFVADSKALYLSSKVFPINWNGEEAKVFIITDITAEKSERIELEIMANKDALTGLGNRYFGMKILREWFEKGRKFCLCFVDLDNLKFVNDILGHSEGDDYIIKVANHTTDIFENAVVCRIGGDEFMILIPDFIKEEADRLIYENRKKLVDSSIENGGEYVASYSFGVVQNDEGQSVSEILGIADERMYDFKRKYKKKTILSQ